MDHHFLNTPYFQEDFSSSHGPPTTPGIHIDGETGPPHPSQFAQPAFNSDPPSGCQPGQGSNYHPGREQQAPPIGQESQDCSNNGVHPLEEIKRLTSNAADKFVTDILYLKVRALLHDQEWVQEKCGEMMSKYAFVPPPVPREPRTSQQ